jgi:hypothetical protein
MTSPKKAFLVDEADIRTFPDVPNGPPFELPKALIDELLSVAKTRMTGNVTMNIKEGVVLSYKVERMVRL